MLPGGKVFDRFQMGVDIDVVQIVHDPPLDVFQQIVALLYAPLARHQHVHRHETAGTGVTVRKAW